MAEENKEQEHIEEQEQNNESTDTGDTSSSDDKNEISEQVDDKDKDKEGDETQTDKNEQSDNESDEDKKSVPYSRFKEVNDKYKAVKKELDELKNGQSNQDDSQENEEDSSTDNGELEHYKTAFNEVYQSKLESVPDEYKDLIPEGDELSKFKWIESAINKGLFSVKAESFGNTGNNPGEQEEQDSTSFIRDLGRKF